MLGISAPEFRHAQAVVPHASNPIKTDALPVMRVLVGGAGIVVCRFVGDSADVSITVPAGGVIDGKMVYVRATSTATLMVAQW